MKTLPVAMMESGPVGGVIAAAEIGKRLGIGNVIAFDMGGTTAKTSLIQGGVVSVAQGYHIGGYASGHPVIFPVVDPPANVPPDNAMESAARVVVALPGV